MEKQTNALLWDAGQNIWSCQSWRCGLFLLCQSRAGPHWAAPVPRWWLWCLCSSASPRLWCLHPETLSGNRSLPVEWIQTSASKICFSLLSAIILLEVVCSSSGPGGHGLKIADLDRYLKKSSLLTLLGFIFLQCGYLVLPYSHHIICSSNMVNKCSWEVYFLASDFQWRRQTLEFSQRVILKYEND